jgi:hypothetical protein
MVMVWFVNVLIFNKVEFPTVRTAVYRVCGDIVIAN